MGCLDAATVDSSAHLAWQAEPGARLGFVHRSWRVENHPLISIQETGTGGTLGEDGGTGPHASAISVHRFSSCRLADGRCNSPRSSQARWMAQQEDEEADTESQTRRSKRQRVAGVLDPIRCSGSWRETVRPNDERGKEHRTKRRPTPVLLEGLVDGRIDEPRPAQSNPIQPIQLIQALFKAQ
jgi:hypothetical protein